MLIRGWARTSLIDFPEHVASVVFTGGCSFRCPMCHNAELVLRPEALPVIAPEDVLEFLRRRKGLVDGLVVTGGEPTLQRDLPDFMRRAREEGVALKLDTNGYHPEPLQRLLEDGLLDYVAMDVKAPPESYAILAGLKEMDLARINTSIHLLRTSGVAHEFRTTVVPDWLHAEELLAIGRWLQGESRYVLQQFRPQGTLDPRLESLEPYSAEDLRSMAVAVQPFFHEVLVRGL